MVLSLDFFNFVKLIGFESIVAGECKSCDFISNFVSMKMVVDHSRVLKN